MKQFKILLVIALVGINLPNTARSDDYYYSLDSMVSVQVATQSIAVQFDTSGTPPAVETFQSSYSCFGPDTAEYIGRGFWAIPLAQSCEYAAAAAEVSADPAVFRVIPAYRALTDMEDFFLTDEITVRFADDLPVASALAILAAEGLQLLDSSVYRHNLWYCALAESIKTSPLAYGNRLHERPETQWAYAKQRSRPVLFGDPPDPYFVNQYYLKNTGQNGGTPGADIKAAQVILV